MILVILFAGIVLIVAAVRNSQGDLSTALKQDVPDFAIWAAAIVALGLIGVVPGLKPVSRGLLGLVFVVIIINNYQKIVAGFQAAWTPKSSSSGSSSSTNSTNPLTDAANSFGSDILHSGGNAIAHVLNPVGSIASDLGIGL